MTISEKEKFEDFFDNTTFDGLHYMLGHHHRHRLVWWLLFLCMIALSIWSGVATVTLYLKFDVKASIAFQSYPEIDFPGLTICSENLLARNAFAGNDIYLSMLKQLSYPDATANQSKIEVGRTCPQTENSRVIDLQTIRSLDLDNIGSILKYFVTSNINIARCWWNDLEISCSGLFFNYIDFSSLLPCYTFNLAKKVVSDNTIKDKNGVEAFSQAFGSGLNVTNYTHLNSKNFGPNTGFQILLNVDQANYCSVLNKWHGAGFLSYVHDIKVLGTYALDKSILLHPGSVTNIFIKPIKFTRKTEHLEKCVSYVDLPLSFFRETYALSLCLMECNVAIMYEKCNCTFYLTSYSRQKLATFYHIPVEKVKSCSMKQYFCAIELLKSSMSFNFMKMCPKRKTPCIERKYDYQISSTMLRPSSFPADKHASNFYSKDFIHKNFAIARFSLESLQVMEVIETQAFTAEDLFIYFGGYLGLFLGISVLSVGEIFQLLCYCVTHYWNYFAFQRVRKIQKKRKVLPMYAFYSRNIHPALNPNVKRK